MSYSIRNLRAFYVDSCKWVDYYEWRRSILMITSQESTKGVFIYDSWQRKGHLWHMQSTNLQRQHDNKWCIYTSLVHLYLSGASIPQWCIYTSVVHLYLSGTSIPQWYIYTSMTLGSKIKNGHRNQCFLVVLQNCFKFIKNYRQTQELNSRVKI